MSDRYFARSASDRTDDWPFWFVADKTTGINVTGELLDGLGFTGREGRTLLSRAGAETLATMVNEDRK